MSPRKIALAAVFVAIAAAIAFYLFRRWESAAGTPREELLVTMPSDASAVLYADLQALRQSPFLSAIYKWAPQPAADPDYSRFVQSTGFDYERDLIRLAVALKKRGQDSTLFAIADGRFDRNKISAYAAQTGARENRNGREIFSVPLSGSSRRLSFTFLREGRIALTDGPELESFLSAPYHDSDFLAWHERFRRLAGSPVFAVIRQDASPGSAFDAQAPGGLRSPQLSALLNQLQWITVAAKPDADRMRIVVEGECANEATMRQFSDLLNGLLALAQAGLVGPNVRGQLAPQVRDAYVELVKSADVSRMDRGETKSVRLVFDVTPKLLEAARTSGPLSSLPQITTKPATRN